MALRIPIGVDDFRVLREENLEYVDKSRMIRELVDRPGPRVVLLPRPRRFGKSLNLSMLRYWFEKSEEDRSHLFRDLAIWQAGEVYRRDFQRYPVIHLSLKETKRLTFQDCWASIKQKIEDAFKAHAYLLKDDRLDAWEARDFRAVIEGSAPDQLYASALRNLSRYLSAYHGENAIILIDEYDEPIHAGHVNGYAAEILDFMRAFFGAGLKGNAHLHKAVVTGILRVAKENLFSGLNNLDVYTLLATQFRDSFGFTEAEVVGLLDRAGCSNRMDEVRSWYNGYLFGGEVIYNPWSVLTFLDRGEERPRAYWVSTSSNDLVRELLELYAFKMEPLFEALLEGGSIERTLDDNIVMSEVRQNEEALWSLLVFSGYLKAEDAPNDSSDRPLYRLSIPNREVREVYAGTFRRWMKAQVEGSGGSLEALKTALIDGDAERFEEELQAFVTNVLSYHDPGKLHPERVYQGFVVGLLAALEPAYQVRSNRESGKGRPDVMIRPRQAGKPGIVLELKVARIGKKTLDEALAEGLEQLASRDYGAELRAAGATPIHAFAVAFDGKEVRVRCLVPQASEA